jgi:hypothetical protein
LPSLSQRTFYLQAGTEIKCRGNYDDVIWVINGENKGTQDGNEYIIPSINENTIIKIYDSINSDLSKTSWVITNDNLCVITVPEEEMGFSHRLSLNNTIILQSNMTGE